MIGVKPFQDKYIHLVHEPIFNHKETIGNKLKLFLYVDKLVRELHKPLKKVTL